MMKNEYKGYKYFLDKDGFWKVMLDTNHLFVVALDDSKLDGKKRMIKKKNNEKACKKYIDSLSTSKLCVPDVKKNHR